MTDFNPLASPWVADFQRRLLGSELSLVTVSPELGLYLGVQLDRPEWHHLYGSRLWAIQGSQAAGVGNPSTVRVRVPLSANPSVLVVIEAIWIDTAAVAAGVQLNVFGAAAADLGTTLITVARDLRAASLSATGAFGVRGSRANVAAAGNAIWIAQDSANSNVIYREPIILVPDSGIDVTTQANNLQLDVSIFGRSRAARPEEFPV